MNALSKVGQALLREATYVDGIWIEDGESGTLTVSNPSTGKALARLPKMSARQVRAAIEAAHRAQQSWRQRSGHERAAYLRRWYNEIIEHADELAALVTLEEGKPLKEARGEIDYAASFVEWFAEEAKRINGDIMGAPRPSQRIVVVKEPVGVCAAITPWNFPAAMITRKAAPALAAGCTMVVKPAEQAPLTGLALAALAEKAGIPPGVLNIVIGDPQEIGPELTGNPLIRKLTFTGSTEVGRLLLAQAASTVKKVSMELGGNAPFIVFDDADLDKAVEGLVACKYRNTGQACISANRVYVQAGVYDAFAERLAKHVSNLRVGDGFDEGVVQGPLIDSDALEKVEAHVADAIRGGARVMAGGVRHSLGGLFYTPTVLSEVSPKMLLCHEETFGPIAALIRFESEDEVIALANKTEHGLAAYLFASGAARIWRVAAALESGMVGINTGLISNEVAPFGGIKQSGIGREGSIHGLEEYLEMKYLAWEGAGFA